MSIAKPGAAAGGASNTSAPQSSDTEDSAVETAAGFVALIGAPNAGKSTLLNALVGAKVSIVSPKVQTTRMRVLGIAIEGGAQIVFVDTPGIFAPRKRLDRAMVHAAWQGSAEADETALLVDARANLRGTDANTAAILAKLGEGAAGAKTALLLNKIDLVEPPQLLALADRFHHTGLFSDVFMVSALSGDGIADLRRHFAARMAPGPWLFPADQLTDMPDRLLAAEIVREKLFFHLQQELPYAAHVETETWEARDDGSVRIEQIIYVQRESQRAIVLGKGGRQIKEIGAAARQELAALLERPVHLFLFVKVAENWQDQPERYRNLGLEWDG